MFDIEKNDIHWTILLTNNIENICRRVVVHNERRANPVVFLVSKKTSDSPYDLLMVEIQRNRKIKQTNVIHSGALEYFIENNSNPEYVIIKAVSSDNLYTFFKYDKETKSIVQKFTFQNSSVTDILFADVMGEKLNVVFKNSLKNDNTICFSVFDSEETD